MPAFSATGMGKNGYVVAGYEATCFTVDSLEYAGELMSEHSGRRQRGTVTEPDVKIRSTHACSVNAYDALARVDDWIGPFLQFSLSRLDVNKCSHAWSSRKRGKLKRTRGSIVSGIRRVKRLLARQRSLPDLAKDFAFSPEEPFAQLR